MQFDCPSCSDDANTIFITCRAAPCIFTYTVTFACPCRRPLPSVCMVEDIGITDYWTKRKIYLPPILLWKHPAGKEASNQKQASAHNQFGINKHGTHLFAILRLLIDEIIPDFNGFLMVIYNFTKQVVYINSQHCGMKVLWLCGK